MPVSHPLEVQIFAFGEIKIAVGGAWVAAGPPKQRTLLGLLLCRAGAEVPAGELIDALWGDRAPDSAPSNLRTYVHRLRRLLGEELITGRGRPGYRLHADRLWIDTEQFLSLSFNRAGLTRFAYAGFLYPFWTVLRPWRDHVCC